MENKIQQLEEKVVSKVDDVAGIKETIWEANQITTEAVRINDPGVGQATVLRHFFFKAAPKPKGAPDPTKEQLISSFKRLIEMSLWSDGLIVKEDKPIEVHTRKSAKKVSPALYRKMLTEKADFVILILAVPRQGVGVADKIHIAK